MSARILLFLAAAAVVVSAFAADWSFEYRPAAVKYAIYGGGLGDPVAPSKKEAKITFEVTGSAAKDIFDSIGPDKKDQCSSDSADRFRSKDADKLTCTLSPSGEYTCYFGFDLKSGKSTGGSIC